MPRESALSSDKSENSSMEASTSTDTAHPLSGHWNSALQGDDVSTTTPLSRHESDESGEDAAAAAWEAKKAKAALRSAVHSLSEHGLKLAAKWAGEQLIGLLAADDEEKASPPRPAKEEQSDQELYAKSLVDMGEYSRAAAVLSAPSPHEDMRPPLPGLTPFGIYLRAYALYMAGERRKEEEVVELREPLERTTLRNALLPQLASELLDYYNSKALDAFGLYIYGVVLKSIPSTNSLQRHQTDSPRAVCGTMDNNDNNKFAMMPHVVFIESIIAYPYNWSAWLDLADLCINDPTIHPNVEERLQPIASHWMYHFFCVHVFLENQANENAILVIERLIHGNDDQGFFVRSPYLQAQLAVAHYNRRDFDAAQSHFLTLGDPYRLDQMDVYSNILYVKEDKVALSQLAHTAVKIDKYRPETCCIVGNYYSLKGQHEKAVQYFQRALKLDRSYLSAWTLMGHEYVEMKNTAAAVEAYRRAVDINSRDYRAWYGLGQTYEIMNMLLYAMFYYRKATTLRPYDARMWCAMGGCYLALDRRTDAIKSYERAVSNHDAEGIATKKLAVLYREDGNVEKAARCFLRHLEYKFQAAGGGGSRVENSIENVIQFVQVDAPEAEALLYLAYYHRDSNELDTAAMCCSRLLEYPGPEKEEGKALLREIRSRLDKRGIGREGGMNVTRRVSQPKKLSVTLDTNSIHHNESMEMSTKDEGGEESTFEFSP